MVLVEGATFRMGSDSQDLERISRETGLPNTRALLPEVPSHDVTVDDFYVDIYDVTNRNFARFVDAVPEWRKERVDASQHNGRYLEHWTADGPPERLLNHPVTFVTWQAAVAYCSWAGKRLPTEAEYEWAAQNPNNFEKYPWGNASPSDDVVSWGWNGIDETVPVGSYPPNSRGLYDMSGNVWHFTADPWLGSHGETLERRASGDDRTSDPTIRRVVRGGSWGASAANLRVRYRDSHRPFDAREMIGFRCAKTAN